MGIVFTKQGIDLGIVVRDAAACLAFYRDVIGLEHVATLQMPRGGVMERLACGDSIIKLVSSDTPPETSNPPGGMRTATGLRYFTMNVEDINEAAARCKEADVTTVMGPLEFRPGVQILMVEDPDGNWVEFVQMDQ